MLSICAICAAVAPDVIEHEAFAQRQVAERQLLGAQPAEDRVEQHRAGDDEVRAARIEARDARAAARDRARSPPCAGGESACAETCRLRSSDGGVPRAAVAATAPMLRIVPDVPMTRSKPAVDDLLAVAIDLAEHVLDELPLVAFRERVAASRTARSGESHPILKLRASCIVVAVPSVISTLPPPMSITTARPPATSDAVHRGLMNQPRLFDAGDDPRRGCPSRARRAARNSPPLRASRVALVAAARISSTRCDSASRLNFDSACSAAVIASESARVRRARRRRAGPSPSRDR